MQNLKKGDVIKCSFNGYEFQVSEVVRHPKYDNDGVPSSVRGHYVGGGASGSDLLYFGGKHPPYNWRDWSVIKQTA